MPRQHFDIRGFNYGIISSLDEEDIPEESASSSLNIDGDAGEGILQGIPTDNIKLIDVNRDGDLLDVGDVLTNVTMGEFIEDDGIYYFVYWDKSDSKLKVIKDFYGALPIKEELLKYTSSLVDLPAIVAPVTFTKENKNLRIGFGNNSALWVGIPKHKQFGITDYTSNFIGTGLNDLSANIAGYTGIKTTYYRVTINNAGTPDTFIYRKENGSNSAPQNIVAGATVPIGDGVTITFAADTGHTVSESWVVIVDGISVEKAELETRYGTAATYINLGQTEHSGTGYFTTGTLYSWKYSLVYDGIEESPIGDDTLAVSDVSANSDYYTILITAEYGLTSLMLWNRRITGINLYRADSTDGTKSGLGLYRLIQSFDINDANWTTATDDRTLTIIDYGTYYSYTAGGTTYPNAIATYEENSGIPETLVETTPKYSLSRTGGGYHFIAMCYHSKIIDATRYIFKSKQLRYDMFDWSSEYLIMPEPITALEYYNGRLFAFSLNATYQINPELFYIEDVFSDAGCSNSRAVNTNEYGMFFCNTNQAWMYNGGQFLLISDAIRQSASSGYNWKSFRLHTLTDFIVVSDSKKGYVLFINERDDTTDKLFAMAYNPLKKRWDAFSFGNYASSANDGAFQGKSGEVYLSNASNTYELMRNTGYQAWEWYSQELTFGATRQVKSITMIKVDATGTVSVTYGLDGGTVNVAGTNEALVNTYAKSIRVKLNAASGSNSVDSLEILYRPLVGLR